MTLTVFFLLLLPAAFAADGKKPKPSAKPQVLSDHDRALHALERLTFGPRPGDIEKVLSLGLDNWIEQQLNPGKIPNGNLDSRLGTYRTLRMQPRELVLAFPNGQLIREAADKKRPLPSDPVQYGLWEVLVTKYTEHQQKNNAALPAQDDAAQKAAEQAAKAAEQSAKETARNVANMLLSLPKPERMPTLMKMPMSDRRALAQYAPGDLQGRLIADFSPAERETYYSMNNPTGVVISELQQAKVLRAVYSEHQLEEVMTDFWFNHFNGWTIQPLDQGWGFMFDPKRHDPGQKTVLGNRIGENGVNEGLQVLDMLSKNPATAKFISTKLARRFVADDPPSALVKQMAQT